MQISFGRTRPRSGSRNASTLAADLTSADISSDARRLARQHRWKRLRQFLAYYRPHLPLLAADLACAVLVSATALALPLCANYVTKQVMQLSSGSDALAQIYLMGAVMLGLLALQIVATFFVDFQGHMMGGRIETQVRRELFEHCQKLSFSFYDRNRVGQLM